MSSQLRNQFKKHYIYIDDNILKHYVNIFCMQFQNDKLDFNRQL